MIHCIVYFSRSATNFEEELPSILEISRYKNNQQQITGAMLYVRGSIVQVLEGEKETIEALYRLIEKDPRHHNIDLVLNRPVASRLFSNWSMGYETMTTQQLEEIQAVVRLDKESAEPNDHIILKTIRVFYDSNRYN